jgi:hypothetical protein
MQQAYCLMEQQHSPSIVTNMLTPVHCCLPHSLLLCQCVMPAPRIALTTCMFLATAPHQRHPFVCLHNQNSLRCERITHTVTAPASLHVRNNACCSLLVAECAGLVVPVITRLWLLLHSQLAQLTPEVVCSSSSSCTWHLYFVCTCVFRPV